MAQGKEWNKEEVVEALKPYFLLDYSINKACELAQFPRSTFLTWYEQDEELRLKVSAWRGMVSAQARQNIVKAISPQKVKDQNGNDITPAPDAELSKWWLERRERKDFSSRVVNALEEIPTVPLSPETEKKIEKYQGDE
jgi:hypothetical protein